VSTPQRPKIWGRFYIYPKLNKKVGYFVAVDPATLKAAAQAAVKVLIDEEPRKKVLAVAIAPVCAIILLLILFFYILTMPLQWLGSFFSSDQYDATWEVRVEHGYD